MINLLFIPYHNTGGHFIDWSLSFVTELNQNLTNAAILQDFNKKTNNWHMHHTIRIQGLDNLKNAITNFENQNVNLYVALLSIDTALKTMFDTNIQSATVAQRSAAYNYTIQDFAESLSWAQDQKLIPIIFDYCESDLMSIFHNDRFPIWNQKKLKDSFAKQELLDQVFFKEAADKFDHEIWDQREKAALTMIKPENHNIYQLINHHREHLYYTTDDVWNNMPALITEICIVLGLTINAEKFDEWKEIYAQWRTVHDPYFGRHFDRIINSIVNGHYMQLDRFNLNFFQEVLIQNALITKHGLNLKTWNLSKFPTNTQELHKLLEPNIHTL
jgi:hypothetical protein